MTRTCRTWTSRRRPPSTTLRRPVAPLPSSWVCTATWTQRVPRCRPRGKRTPSSVPDVLAPGLACVFCGINPGRVSAAAAAHFANPRNDFWRLLHDAGFTPRLYDPQEQHDAARARLRADERRVPDDARVGRPAARRLRPGRVRGAHRGRLAARGRVRRQGGVPRPLERAARARPAGAVDRRAPGSSCFRRRRPRTRPCRTPSGCAGSRRCASGSSPSSGRPCARSCSTPTTACCSSSSSSPVTGDALVGLAGRRHRPGREPRGGAAARARGGDRAARTSSSARSSTSTSSARFPGTKVLYRQRNTTYLVRVARARARADDRPRGGGRRRRPLVERRRARRRRTEQFAPPDLAGARA